MTNPNSHLPVPRDLIAPSYGDAELISRLYLENSYLKSLRPTFNVGDGVELPDSEVLAHDARYAFTRQFLRETKEAKYSRHLILANEYPSKRKRYANGFVHRRVKYYQENGADVDVMAFGKRVERDIYGYDGVKVLAGYVNELAGLLSAREYTSISVHFMNSEMWKVLKNNIPDSTRLIVYVHGYEVRNWSRLPYGIKNHSYLNARIERSLRNEDVWREIDDTGRVRFVFVSDWWRSAAMDDLNLVFDDSNSTVIHNFVDPDLFDYQEKDADQRFKILWVRSANAYNYGADIAAEFLRKLQQTEVWGQLDVQIIGDGQYFEEFREFEGDPVVTLRQEFISQDEIASLHKEYGFFLVPTRFDTQGVSRDEAMSSGLIPITCPVTAVPEFTDETTSVLFDENTVETAVMTFLEIASDPVRFREMSHAAAARVRAQNGTSKTVDREMILMGEQEK